MEEKIMVKNNMFKKYVKIMSALLAAAVCASVFSAGSGVSAVQPKTHSAEPYTAVHHMM
ncbi:MAG: hypothetical protein IJ251_09670 [Oscillospiraceae bacterium]|nr:hypothetical protein [Oscillospiraceae bacterium]